MKLNAIPLMSTLAAGLLMVSAGASAVTTPYVTASTGTITTAGSQNVVKDSGPQRSTASAAQGSNGPWGSASAGASVDVVAGTLGGSAAASYGDASRPYVYSQFQAVMGDGFRSYDEHGSPFSWNTADTARFTLDIDGTLAASTSLTQLGVSSYVALILYAPGSVQPGMNLFGDPGAKTWFLYTFGNPNQHNYYSPDGVNQIELFPTRYMGDPTLGSLHIEQDFTPDGDFDWVLLMSSGGAISQPGSFSVDLSHTATFGYQGPAGSVTQSVSGQFGNITNPSGTAVPEPSSLALMGLSLLALVGRRRIVSKL